MDSSGGKRIVPPSPLPPAVLHWSVISGPDSGAVCPGRTAVAGSEPPRTSRGAGNRCVKTRRRHMLNGVNYTIINALHVD